MDGQSKRMTYQIQVYEKTALNLEIFENLKRQLNEFLVFTKQQPDYLFIIGGDGTFLNFANPYLDTPTKIIGINTGTLGFYCELNKEVLQFTKEDLIKLLHSEKFFHPLILHSKFYDQNQKLLLETNALNDVVLQSPFTLKADLYLNDKYMFNKFVGSGFILCTPTGSTAINKSNNGPVFFSSLNAYCLSFIMPINNNKFFNYTSPFLFDQKEMFAFELVHFKNLDFLNDGMLINQDIIQKTHRVKMQAKKARCEILLAYGCLETIQRMKKFF